MSDKTYQAQENRMDLPILIAVLALLAWTLLPQLDRYAEAEVRAEGVPSYLTRLARWVNK
jgi:hypothetical protein